MCRSCWILCQISFFSSRFSLYTSPSSEKLNSMDCAFRLSCLWLLVEFGQWEAPAGNQKERQERMVWVLIPLASSLCDHFGWLDPSMERHCSSGGGLLHRLFPSSFSNLDLVLLTPSHLGVVTALLSLAKCHCTILCDSPTSHPCFCK